MKLPGIRALIWIIIAARARSSYHGLRIIYHTVSIRIWDNILYLLERMRR